MRQPLPTCAPLLMDTCNRAVVLLHMSEVVVGPAPSTVNQSTISGALNTKMPAGKTSAGTG